MEKGELLMVAMEAFPDLNAHGFFTLMKESEYYFSGLQKMEIQSAYKSFYEEYDLAFSIRCTFSICDFKSGLRWIRKEGNQHVYETPMLYIINRSELNSSPEQIVNKMNTQRANVLLIEKYNHPVHSLNSLKSYLSANGKLLILASELREARDRNQKSKDKNQEPAEWYSDITRRKPEAKIRSLEKRVLKFETGS